MADASVSQARNDDNVRVLAIVVYILMLLSFANGFTALAAVVLAYIKRADAKGSVYQSHYTNAIVTFWLALLGVTALCATTLGLVFGAIGFHGEPEELFILHPWMWVYLPAVGMGFVLLAIYCLYRTARGLVHAFEARPY
jgi:uncharacterized membrane protein